MVTVVQSWRNVQMFDIIIIRAKLQLFPTQPPSPQTIIDERQFPQIYPVSALPHCGHHFL